MRATSILVLALASALWLSGQTADNGSRDQLQRLTTQLQQSSGDQALREKIIALVLTMRPRPATPDDAIMAEGGAEYAFKNAKAESDYSKAAQQYEKALLLAPWSAVDYFNCGVAHEKAGETKEAIRSFSLYLLAAPAAEDALAVKKRIGGLQYAQQSAIDDANSPAAQFAKFLKTLDGGVWRCVGSSFYDSVQGQKINLDVGHTYIAVSGRTMNGFIFQRPIISGSYYQGNVTDIPFDPRAKPAWNVTITDRILDAPLPDRLDSVDHWSDKVSVSEDGQAITEDISGVAEGRYPFTTKRTYVRQQ